MKKEVIEGDRATQIKLVILLSIFISILVVAVPLSEKYEQIRKADNVEELRESINLLLIFLPVEAVILGCLAVLSIYFGFQIIKHGRWPLDGMRVIYRRKVRRGKYASAMWIGLKLIAALFIFEVCLKLYKWYLIFKVYKVLTWMDL